MTLDPETPTDLDRAHASSIALPAATPHVAPGVLRGQPPPKDAATLLALHCMLTV